MKMVMEKTKELGRAIMESEEYKKFRDAELAAMTDETAATWLTEMITTKSEIGTILEQKHPDGERLRMLEHRMKELDEKISILDSIQVWRNAKAEFETMIQMVNQELKSIIVGETSNNVEPDMRSSEIQGILQ